MQPVDCHYIQFENAGKWPEGAVTCRILQQAQPPGNHEKRPPIGAGARDGSADHAARLLERSRGRNGGTHGSAPVRRQPWRQPRRPSYLAGGFGRYSLDRRPGCARLLSAAAHRHARQSSRIFRIRPRLARRKGPALARRYRRTIRSHRGGRGHLRSCRRAFLSRARRPRAGDGCGQGGRVWPWRHSGRPGGAGRRRERTGCCHRRRGTGFAR